MRVLCLVLWSQICCAIWLHMLDMFVDCCLGPCFASAIMLILLFFLLFYTGFMFSVVIADLLCFMTSHACCSCSPFSWALPRVTNTVDFAVVFVVLYWFYVQCCDRRSVVLCDFTCLICLLTVVLGLASRQEYCWICCCVCCFMRVLCLVLWSQICCAVRLHMLDMFVDCCLGPCFASGIMLILLFFLLSYACFMFSVVIADLLCCTTSHAWYVCWLLSWALLRVCNNVDFAVAFVVLYWFYV